MSKPRTVYTLSALSQHSHPTTSPSSQLLTAVHGNVYDLTSFAASHPGGDLIYLGGGKDSTALWETYHPSCTAGTPSRKNMDRIMEGLKVGELDKKDGMDGFYDWSSDFYPTLKKRACEVLRQNKLPRRGGNGSIAAKALLLLAVFWTSLYLMCTLGDFRLACAASMVMGATASFVGTCIQHDGSHGAFSNNVHVNKVAGWTLDMIGASAYTWEIQHMLGHHPYTNLLDVAGSSQESDPDVFSSYPMMRMHPHHDRYWYHKYQHMYAPSLFAMMTILKVFMQDFEIIVTGKLYHIDASCRYSSVFNRIRFWCMKLISVGYMIVLPCYYQGVVKGLALFVLGHLTCGELLATMFIVNHVIEGVAFAKKNVKGVEDVKRPVTVSGSTPMIDLQKRVGDKEKKVCPLNDWAAVQCQTSVNWSISSHFWNHFSGGLNHQIEHHLFPSICHTNYPTLQKVVEETCEEFGVPYQHERSLGSAYGKMIAHLRWLGGTD
jgi:linoleoyl-CoA desaturase